MTDGTYLKGPCTRCGNNIEFPEAASGSVVNCPHCGQPTQLRAGTPPPTLPPRSIPVSPPATPGSPVMLIVTLVCVGVLVACSALFLFSIYHRPSVAVANPPPEPPQARTSTSTAPAVVRASAQSPSATPTTEAQPSVKRSKSPDDLKTGDIQFEKPKGSSLVFAVGNLTNDSDYQRFGIRLKLDLLNRQGTNVGSASDYKDVLEPHKTWQFRAMVIEKRATSARIAEIKEDQ